MTPTGRAKLIPVTVLTLGSAAALSILAPRIWPILILDGGYALLVLVAAIGWGAWPVVWLGMSRETPLRQTCLAAGLGLGVTSMVTLVLGLAGLLNGVSAWGLIWIGVTLGVVRLYPVRAVGKPVGGAGSADAPMDTNPRQIATQSLVLLALAVPLAVMLFGACLPPGLIWIGEGRGYDVLEYHLQVPREYFEAGHITFLAHNVYASFPQQVEMQYLLLMHTVSDPYDAAIPAQLLHALMGVLTVVALAAWTPAGWARTIVVLVVGSVPWLAYLGCLAYVELGLMFFTALAAGIVTQVLRDERRADWRSFAVAGTCAGLAGGCKYTAVVLVAVALALAYLLVSRQSWQPRVQRLAVYACGVAVALSPWLIRNTAFTGNPVYPFAYKVFGGIAWSPAQDAQWSAGHQHGPDQQSTGAQLRKVVSELFLSGMFGPVVFLLALGGLVLSRDRAAGELGLWSVLMLAAWLWLTHLPGRFLVPLVVPMGLLSGRVLDVRPLGGSLFDTDRGQRSARWVRSPLVALAVAGALWNGANLWHLLRVEDDAMFAEYGISLEDVLGATRACRDGNLVGSSTPPDSYVWLVGPANVFYVDRAMHYNAVFNRDPWLQYAKEGHSPAECIDWLRSRNVTHVVFSWSEIDRLRKTYGFAEIVTHDWVAKLKAAGLREVAELSPQERAKYELLEVADDSRP